MRQHLPVQSAGTLGGPQADLPPDGLANPRPVARSAPTHGGGTQGEAPNGAAHRAQAAPQPPSPLHVEPIPDGIPPHASSILIVDLDAVRTNYRALRMIAGRADCAGVVKADAYGLGLEPVVRALLTEGCRTFFVANIDEAWRTRQLAPDATIYVLNGLYPGSAAAFADLNAQPVLGSTAEVTEWVSFCTLAGQRLPAAVHVDTGMNRLGLRLQEAQELQQRRSFDGFDVTLMMSHLASADSPGSAFNAHQRQAFDAARQLFPQVPASLANSAATLLGPSFHYDLVRPGIAVYGGSALQGVPNPMKPVVRLLARIVQVREVPTGETIGYGQTYRTQRATRLAVVATGYADGFPRGVTNPSPSGKPPGTGSMAHLHGHAAPIVGRVSMDLIGLDATDVPAHHVTRGAFAELIGPHTRVDDVAAHAGTIGYEILTRLSRRSHRVYMST